MEVKHTPETEIIEGNKLIAEFMQFDISNWEVADEDARMNTDNGWLMRDGTVEDLEFHTSWDWLMPVVDKLEEMEFRVMFHRGAGKTHYCDIWKNTKKIASDSCFESRITAVWATIVQAIKWYNQSLITKATK